MTKHEVIFVAGLYVSAISRICHSGHVAGKYDRESAQAKVGNANVNFTTAETTVPMVPHRGKSSTIA